jgi:molybdopterin-binding protein
MKLSARNQLSGTVQSVNHGAVTTTVAIELAGGDVVTASITRDAADELGVRPGAAVVAVIKASDVMVAIED